MTHHRDIPPAPEYPATDDQGRDEPVYTDEERTRDRAALISELRAQILSGEYKPSIGRISMGLLSNLAGD